MGCGARGRHRRHRPSSAPAGPQPGPPQGYHRGLVARQEKCDLLPSTRPRVYVGKLLVPDARTIASPPRHTATHIGKMHASTASRTYMTLRLWQRLSGHLTWATAHTRYFRAAAAAPVWRAFFRGRRGNHPRRAIALNPARRAAIMTAAAAAAVPLRGTIVLASTISHAPFPLTTPEIAIITDAQFHHSGAAGAITILRHACFQAGACRCPPGQVACRVLRISVPLRYSAYQPHAECYTFFRAVALTPPTIPVAAVYSDCRVASLGLPKLRAPTRSTRLISLCKRLSQHLSRSPTAFIADSCPGGEDNPSDFDARQRLAFQLATHPHHIPPTTTHPVTPHSWHLIKQMSTHE